LAIKNTASLVVSIRQHRAANISKHNKVPDISWNHSPFLSCHYSFEAL